MAIVFDSSALLAIAFDETGAERAAEALPDGILSAVNASEVVACLIDRGVPEASARNRLRDFDIPVRPFDETLALPAGSPCRTRPSRDTTLGQHRFHGLQFFQVNMTPDSVSLRFPATGRGLLLADRPDLARAARMEPAARGRV